MKPRKFLSLAAACGLLVQLAAACELGTVEEDLDLDSTVAAIEDENGSWWNGSWWNGSWWNGSWWNGSWWNGVSAAGQVHPDIAYYALSSSEFRKTKYWRMMNTEGSWQDRLDALEVLKGMVKCALPEGKYLPTTVTYDHPLYGSIRYNIRVYGQIGVAPEWAVVPVSWFLGRKVRLPEPACDETCQRWTTACFLSLLNPEHHVPVSLRGNHEALATALDGDLFDGQGEDLYTHPEATFYGNMFKPTQEIYACEGDEPFLPYEGDAHWLTKRVCGDNTEDCLLVHLGYCSDLGVCAIDPSETPLGADHGWYSDCKSDLPKLLMPGEYAAPIVNYSETITVYLDPSSDIVVSE